MNVFWKITIIKNPIFKILSVDFDGFSLLEVDVKEFIPSPVLLAQVLWSISEWKLLVLY
jgi:hypothetical protein